MREINGPILNFKFRLTGTPQCVIGSCTERWIRIVEEGDSMIRSSGKS